MGSHDPRIDAYIAKAAPFAQPILDHLRAVVHEAHPEVVETIKWSRPFFEVNGALLCNMSAFKQHCSFGFWLGGQVLEKAGEGMGQFGKITSLDDLPPRKKLLALVKKAASLNQAGVRHTRKPGAPKPPPALPDKLAAQLAQRKYAAARKNWEGFPPSAQRDYVDWITEAKTDATREKRITTTLEWLAEGKRRHWKYEKE